MSEVKKTSALIMSRLLLIPEYVINIYHGPSLSHHDEY